MLMHKADRLVSSPDWTYEPKWDGFRMIATVRDGSVHLFSRNGRSFTRVFGPVSDALRRFPASLVLDGEVLAITDEDRPDFEALQQRLRPRDGRLPGHVCSMVFDCCASRPLRRRSVGVSPTVGQARSLVAWSSRKEGNRRSEACRQSHLRDGERVTRSQRSEREWPHASGSTGFPPSNAAVAARR